MTCRVSLWWSCFLLAGSCLAGPQPGIHKKLATHAATEPMHAQDTIRVGSLTLHPCPDAPAYCGSVLRALDPTGQVRGTIEIQFEYYPHTGPEANG